MAKSDPYIHNAACHLTQAERAAQNATILKRHCLYAQPTKITLITIHSLPTSAEQNGRCQTDQTPPRCSISSDHGLLLHCGAR